MTDDQSVLLKSEARQRRSPEPGPRLGRRSDGRKPRQRKRIKWSLYLILLPTFALLGIFNYYPDINGLVHSFFDWRPGYTSPFVGLQNYVQMIHDSVWWTSFAHIGIIFVFGCTVMWAIPLLAAELVITLSGRRAQFIFQTLLIVPMAFPSIVTVLLWEFLYDPNVGVINTFLKDLGLGALAQNWLGNPHIALLALIFIGFPWIAGLPFLIFLSGLKNVPIEIFDAAMMDGAGRLRRFRYIDLPLLLRQLRLLLFLAVIQVLQYGFAAYVVTLGGPGNATQVPVLQMLATAFQEDNWGYAATLSTVLFFLMLVFGALTVLLRRRDASRVRVQT